MTAAASETSSFREQRKASSPTLYGADQLSVLHVLWSLDIGGAERAVFQLVQEQNRLGVRADVLVGGRAGVYGECARRSGAVVHELGQRSALDLRRARSAGRIFGLYDVAHFHGREPLLMAVARRQRAVRLVYTHRGGIKRYGWAKRLRHRWIASSLTKFDALSANTHQSAKAANRIFGIPAEEFRVIYNGIDFSLLEPSRPRSDVLAELRIPDGTTVVGTCAKLLALKRVDRLVQAVASLRLRAVHCVVIGDGPERRRLEELSRRLGVSRQVTFTGLQESVGDYLQALNIFVLPSGPDEGFGNALVEAMALGIPSVVFADGGGLVEHIADQETGIIAADEADLEMRLAQLLADAELRARLGAAARDVVRSKYALGDSIARYADLYAGALEPQRSRAPNDDRTSCPRWNS